MKPEDVIRLYDHVYAASYDRRFLETFPNGPAARHELELIRSLLAPGAARWLDVACGTGYFLSRFPELDRAGLDISPAMLELARACNPTVEFRRHDFRDPLPEWNGRFDLVSCMWYAYCLVDTFDEISQVIANLASWTAPTGCCFLPLADPDLIADTTLPDRIPYGLAGEELGEMRIDGIVWSYSEPTGKAHRHLVSPSVVWMHEELGRYFEVIDTIRYPQVDESIGRRGALVARTKRAACRERR